ncbi:Crp/Fnr family transcriptional regulator [Thioalkalivibrio thiocyanodenitrificans]|uniref:Crp/Fnr family transcriptional regulator n=1 Tax=Thioalkalivibrio thiocyanodenitrificans TaxID=243063 RepID=UPI0003A0B0DC|nr:Crp/Fnr family transcriptional regulator [Thioalkalivibrio thiocyanodenitrificans]
MIPVSSPGGTGAQGKELLRLFRDLPEEHRRTLLAFARFLAAEDVATPAEIPEPEHIPRPDEESVVRAMKRLSASYHMLDKSKLLNETSALMAQHVMQGRPAQEVIDELEAVFEAHYRQMAGRE